VLEVVYRSRFAHLAHPPLEERALTFPPRLPRHAGTTAYLRRAEPFLTASNVDALNNTLGVIGALLGGTLFFWQGLRQLRASRRERLFGDHMLRVAGLERRIVELELSAELALEPLMELQRELLRLKSEALARFAEGKLGDQSTLSDLLAPIDAARDHVGSLLLHVRDNLEEQAQSEGRSVDAVWEEAAEAPERR
jgi:hypothetical protein